MPNIFRALARDHREIESVVTQLLEPPAQADFDRAARRHLLDHLVVAASRHEAREELVFWPAVRKRVRDGRAMTEVALEQERDSKYILDALRFMSSEDSVHDEARQLAQVVRSHISFEEDEVWPALQRAISRTSAHLLGVKFWLAGKAAPTRPHPRGPDTPLGLVTKGSLIAMVDRARDRLSGRRTTHPDPEAVASRPDAVTILTRDHAAIEAILSALDGDTKPDPRLVAQLVREVSIHGAIEREHLYPLLRKRLDDGNERYGDWLAEHGEMATMLAEIDRRPEGDPYRRELIERLIPLLRTHIAQEEGAVLPALRSLLADEELAELGRTLDAARNKAPTRPHGHLAGAGLGARLSRVVIAPFDKTRDALAGRR